MDEVKKEYTADFDDVFIKEQEYLAERRKKVLGEQNPSLKELCGIAFSGGGIRSATFCLGVMQGLIKSGMFKFFDYMSTVSGGGYIGSCLSSLLAHDQYAGVKPDDSPFVGLRGDKTYYTNAADTELNVRNQLHHLREHASYLAVDSKIGSRDMQRMIGTFSFGVLYHLFLFTLVGLAMVAMLHFVLLLFSRGDADELWKKTKLANATANTYLSIIEADSSICTQPKIDSVLAQIVDSSFNQEDRAALSAIVCDTTLTTDERIDSANYYIETTNEYYDQWESAVNPVPDLSRLGFVEPENRSTSPLTFSIDTIWNVVGSWHHSIIKPRFEELYSEQTVVGNPALLFTQSYYRTAFLGGIAFAGILFWFLIRVRRKMTYWVHSSVDSPEDTAWFNKKVLSGETPSNTIERRFIKIINIVPILVCIIGTAMYKQLWNKSLGLEVLSIPLAFALGAYATIFLASIVWETRQRVAKSTEKNAQAKEQINTKAKKPIPSRITRSLLASVRGAGLYGVIVAAVTPPLTILMLSVSYFSYNFFLSVILLAAGSYLFSKGDAKINIPQTLIQKLYKPLLNIIVLLFLLTAFAPATSLLTSLYEISYWWILPVHSWFVWACILFWIMIGTGLVCLITWRVNANRLSAHYFYRDRLAEAYLMTNSRVERDATEKQQGMPRKTVRNNDEMRLQEIGKNFNAPYHLIVTALNLRGSDEVLRRTMKTDHFIMSRDWVGSHTTGYVRTNAYHEGGNLRLATAMTISAAAFTSIVGFRTFLAQSLISTVLNVRLGYWIENPLYHKSAGSNEKGMQRPNRKSVLWIRYLLHEILGNATARKPFINLSDGGHTGDNLGLLPLLQRRCKVIVVVDAEADPRYEFESFNSAARMALVEENITIDIDFTPIIRKSEKNGDLDFQQRSIAIGNIYYPEVHEKPGNTSNDPVLDKNKKRGVLIYIKASCSEYDVTNITRKLDKESLELLRTMIDSEKAPSKVEVPPHVVNYNRSHKEFPHQSTLNQFYDTAQFEAYRALGKYIARQLSAAICNPPTVVAAKVKQPPPPEA